ncbi:MAG: hypothetical protein MJ229_03915 [bacterium]|nr:hypothetical protein [bacterium]
MSVCEAKFLKCLIVDVKTPAISNIKLCPIENDISISIDINMFFVLDANAIMLASIGVEQGVPAIENTQPNKNG